MSSAFFKGETETPEYKQAFTVKCNKIIYEYLTLVNVERRLERERPIPQGDGLIAQVDNKYPYKRVTMKELEHIFKTIKSIDPPYKEVHREDGLIWYKMSNGGYFYEKETIAPGEGMRHAIDEAIKRELKRWEKE